jgi:hypothetical protein
LEIVAGFENSSHDLAKVMGKPLPSNKLANVNNIHIIFKNLLIEDEFMDIPLCKLLDLQVDIANVM